MPRTLRLNFLLLPLLLLLTAASLARGAETAPLFTSAMQGFEARAAAADPEHWSFVFLGDNRGNDAKFKQILERARELHPLFILHGGDVAERGTGAELDHFLELVCSVKGLPPLFVVRGNHETDAGLFEKRIAPLNFTLDSKRLGLRLVTVDNADYTLRERELNYLKERLDGTRPIQIVAMHIPPKTARWPKHSFDRGRSELLSLMEKRKVNMGLFAHIHLFDKDSYQGIPLLVSGGAGSQLAWYGYSGEAVYHLVVVEVNKGKVSYRVERFETTLMP